MGKASATGRTMRRSVLFGVPGLALGLVVSRMAVAGAAGSDSDPDELIRRLTGRSATESARVQLRMPAAFGNGYSVPMALAVDSPMTEADHVRLVQVVAPRNPIVVVAAFHFTPASGRVDISTRVRLAQPQTVLALAEMSDGTLLMASAWVKVDTDGCA